MQQGAALGNGTTLALIRKGTPLARHPPFRPRGRHPKTPHQGASPAKREPSHDQGTKKTEEELGEVKDKLTRRKSPSRRVSAGRDRSCVTLGLYRE